MGLQETYTFLREGITNFHHTGTLFSTSPWAASALAGPLHEARGPRRILEVGAGTGSVTEHILEHMIPGDQLVTCEINSRFVKVLRERMSENSLYRKFQKSVTVFEGPIQSLQTDVPFDFIVCALPFLNFDIKTVEEIFSTFERVSTPRTLLTYYEYIGLRALGRNLSLPERQQRISKLDSYFKEKHTRLRLGKTRVWRNLLPIDIHLLRVVLTPGESFGESQSRYRSEPIGTFKEIRA